MVAIEFDPEGKIKEATGLSDKPVGEVIINILNYLLGFLSLLGIIMILYGGFMWLTSQGNQEKVDKAKKIINTAILGIITILFSYSILYFVLKVINLAVSE